MKYLNKNVGWVWTLVGRVVIYALSGAVLCGIAGLFSGGMAGRLAEWIARSYLKMDMMGFALVNKIPISFYHPTLHWEQKGALYSGAAAMATSATYLGILGLLKPPDPDLLPPRPIMFRVLVIVSVATFTVTSTYFIWQAVAYCRASAGSVSTYAP